MMVGMRWLWTSFAPRAGISATHARLSEHEGEEEAYQCSSHAQPNLDEA